MIRTAMVVDDEISHREVVGEILIERGWQVLEAATGEQALALLTKSRPAVLITDINLGNGMDGWTLGAIAKRQWPEMGLLFISGERQAGQHHQICSSRFLQKPFSLSALLVALSDVARWQPTST